MICRLITMWSPGYVRVLRERTKNRRQSILHFLLGELRLEPELDSYIRDKRARFSDFPHGPTTLLASVEHEPVVGVALATIESVVIKAYKVLVATCEGGFDRGVEWGQNCRDLRNIFEVSQLAAVQEHGNTRLSERPRDDGRL
jgi:hypothetical protein